MTILPLALLIAAFQPAAAIERIPPVDQCAVDRSFAAFRAALRRAVGRQDRAAVLAALAPDISSSFGGDSGREAFARHWRLDRAGSELWSTLDSALALGCARLEDGSLVAPAMVAQFEEVEDPSSALLAVRSGALLWSRPDDRAAAIASLAWDVLRFRTIETPNGWLAVRLADGREGYVRASDVRRPLDYRLYFRKQSGHWRIIALVAGD